ncbi:hypothetical protein GJ496_000873 [Pomphorhynchus laevis]|nr:hypothetical protein GJ496_000873 [Pomphorhynchus laevis]
MLEVSGFQLITVDVDRIPIGYPNLVAVMSDLKTMSLSNFCLERPLTIRRDVLIAADAISKQFLSKIGEHEGICMTFEVAYLIGWKLDNSKIKIARRGRPQVSFNDISK